MEAKPRSRRGASWHVWAGTSLSAVGAIAAFVITRGRTRNHVDLHRTGPSECTVSCTAGCGAIYSEPNGPCNTFCSGQDLTALELGDAPFSIQLSDFPADKLVHVFPGFGETLRGVSGSVSLSHKGVTRDQLPGLIRKALG